MRSSFNEAVQQIKIDALRGNQLFKETEHFFDIAAELAKRVGPSNTQNMQPKKEFKNKKGKEISSIY